MKLLTLRRFVGALERQSKESWAVILKRDPCAYCGRCEAEIPGGSGRKWRTGNATKMTIEHVVPRGIDAARPPGIENKVAACWNCNHTRNNLPLLAYLLYRQTQDARFLPGPNNARNRLWKAERRHRIETQCRDAMTRAPGLRWALSEAFGAARAVDAVDPSAGIRER